MSSTDEVTFDAPAKKKPAKKRAKARAPAARAKKPAAPFPGLTCALCADTCYATSKCAISGSYCAHPCKGGLQAPDMANAAAKKRLQEARDQIDIRLDPDRFK